MLLGLVHVNTGPLSRPQALAEAAQAAEAAGFDSVWAGEHLVLPDPRVPPSPMAPQDPALDSLLALTWAAAHTSTIRLATGTAGRVLSIVTDRANAELAGPDLS